MYARNRMSTLLVLVIGVSTGFGQTTQPTATQPCTGKDEPTGALQGKVEKASATEHEVTINGELVKYRATAATMPMKDEAGKLKATVFFIAYEKDKKCGSDSTDRESPEADPAKRPITFVFNGGPGAAAVWLHLGTAGPRRIELKEDGTVPAPPYRLIDNPNSWLAATDLVFIDPVGTGFSRPAEGEKPEQFYGVTEDISWVADFIRLYVTKYERWLSPKFLAGESYGTTRAAGLSEHLLERFGITLNGIILISSVLDFQTLQPGDSNDLPFVLYLPSYTAVAWYHSKLSDELQADRVKTLKEVEQWASSTYTIALARGNALPDEQRQTIIRRLAGYTGLPTALIEKGNLRIAPWVFEKYLLADERKLIGRFDARITGFDPEPVSNHPTYDPSLTNYLPVYSTTFNDYVRRALKYESVLPYEVLTDRVRPWKFGETGHGYLSVVENLRSAMVKNPHLKVMFASGWFDLATPYFASDYTIQRLDLGPELQDNITHYYYMGGHMMYHNQASQKQLQTDVVTFIRSALPE